MNCGGLKPTSGLREWAEEVSVPAGGYGEIKLEPATYD